jgi:hypothetical protein
MSSERNRQVDEKELAPLRRATNILSNMGVSVSDVLHFVSDPETEFECTAASVTCNYGSLSFSVTYNGQYCQTHLASDLTIFPDDQAITPGSPIDTSVENFMSWLVDNAPLPIEVRRSYGRLTTDDPESSDPDFPIRGDHGGSVSLLLEIVMPWKALESAIIVDGVVVSDDDTAQDNQYSGMSLDEALPVLLDFMERAQSLEMLPQGSRWSA